MAFLDKTGVERLWAHIISKLGGKVDKVEGKGLSTNDYTAEDKDKLATIQEGAEANVQSDWNQNDSSAKDYVKNRTHWEETGCVTLVDNISVTADSEETVNPFSLTIDDGATYKVTWNNVEYECVAYIAEGPNTPSIGNGNLGNVSGGNNEPFFITVYYGDVLLFAQDAGTYTISIEKFDRVVHKIDDKYLSDNIPKMEIAELLSETSVEIEESGNPAIDPFKVELVADTVYTVIFDGDEYNCMSYVMPNINCISIGNGEFASASGGNGEPFLLAVLDGQTVMFAQDTGTHTISIKGGYVIQESNIPSTIARKSDVPKFVHPNWIQNNETATDYINNRTHYYGDKFFGATWFDNVTITGFVDGYAEYTDITPEGKSDWNRTSTYNIIWDGVEYSNLAILNDDAIGVSNCPVTLEYYSNCLYVRTIDQGDTHTLTVKECVNDVTIQFPELSLRRYSTVYSEVEGTIPKASKGLTYHIEGTLKIDNTTDVVVSQDFVNTFENDNAKFEIEMEVENYGNLLFYLYDSQHVYWPNQISAWCDFDADGHTVSGSFTISCGIKKIDEDFIPNTIARKEDIPHFENIEVDPTLSIEGKAADAKAVGDAIEAASGLVIINITDNGDGTYSADKTFAEITTEYQNEKTIYAFTPNQTLIPIRSCKATVITFGSTVDTGSLESEFVSISENEVTYLMTSTSYIMTINNINQWSSNFTLTVGDIGAGTFAGAVRAGEGMQEPTTTVLRNSAFVVPNSIGEPTISNGEILWYLD